MKRIITLIIIGMIALFAAPQAEAQWIKDLGKKAVKRAKERSKQKVEDKVNEKVDKTVDKVFETGEDIVTGKEGEEEHAEEEAVEKKTTADPKAKKDEQPQVGKDAEMSWNKFDFVAGDEIMFEDLLVGEQLGEFPSMWDLIEGNVEIAKVDGENAISLYKTSQIKPLMKEPKNYLPESFTIELDFFMYKNHEEKLSQGTYQFYLMDENKEILHFYFWGHPDPSDNQIATTTEYISASGEDKRIYAGAPFTGGGWHRLSLSFNKRALKIYIDQTRVANAPNCAQPKWFNLMGDYSNSGGETIFYIRNVRIAKGAVPLYDRMMSDGKFITYGITFDVGKSTIKPESMGEINRIVKLMQDNPDLKFSVEGHTDSTGNEATNQTLSDARSKAVVDKLVEMGIAADRLTSSGKGQSNPIADNGTDEGRAKNRRVEFVKQ